MLRRYEGHTDAVTAVAIQPTGKMFASASADRDIKLWTCTPEEAAEPAAVGKASGKRRRVGKAPVEVIYHLNFESRELAHLPHWLAESAGHSERECRLCCVCVLAREGDTV